MSHDIPDRAARVIADHVIMLIQDLRIGVVHATTGELHAGSRSTPAPTATPDTQETPESEIGVDHTRQTAGRGLATGSWRAALNQSDLMFPGRLDRA